MVVVGGRGEVGKLCVRAKNWKTTCGQSEASQGGFVCDFISSGEAADWFVKHIASFMCEFAMISGSTSSCRNHREIVDDDMRPKDPQQLLRCGSAPRARADALCHTHRQNHLPSNTSGLLQ